MIEVFDPTRPPKRRRKPPKPPTAAQRRKRRKYAVTLCVNASNEQSRAIANKIVSAWFDGCDCDCLMNDIDVLMPDLMEVQL